MSGRPSSSPDENGAQSSSDFNRLAQSRVPNSLLMRLARNSALSREAQRLQVIAENPNLKPRKELRWLTPGEQTTVDEEKLEYVKPYQAEYLNNGKTDASASSVTESLDDDSSCQDDRSSIRSSTELSEVASLCAIRGRAGRLRGRAMARSVIDFERTSTIQAPTEMATEEYSSTIQTDEIRRCYFKDYRTTDNLPISGFKNFIINSIQSYSVVLIEGMTGCGKTTQVPVYILEDAILNAKQPSCPVIYVTQPRRIAARSIAQRVCDEHNWELGSIVGYQVGLDKKAGPQTILIFCTAGVLLQKLIQDKSLKNYSHIIIDEAHERDADTDLLLMMIRTLMRHEMSFFRLIVMSATMDVVKLKSYFTFKINYNPNMAVQTPSICKVGAAKKVSNVQIMYYDRLRTSFNLDDPVPDFDSELPELHEACLTTAVKLIIEIIPYLDTFSIETQSTLVFLPGIAEISKLHRMLMVAKDQLDIIPLHSCLSVNDQNRVFRPARDGMRKVILATNIAESSITVQDVGFIVDFCLTKTIMKDELTRFPTLKLQWSTKDKCTQRSGRTGRCCPGKVFRMVTQRFFNSFDEFAQPELLTAPLELSVLRVKNFQMGEIKALFAVVLDPPPLHEIRTAVLELKQIGALSSTFEGKLSDLDGDLTELGRVISTLPIDVHLSKLIVIAFVLDVVEDAIIIAACLSTNRTVVKQLYGNELESYDSKLNWANGSYSDLFVCLDVYKEYIHYKDEQAKSAAWIATFCHNRNLDDRKLFEVSTLVAEIKQRLEGINIKLFEQPNRVRDRNEDELMLKIALCASFYPNYFLSQDMDATEIEKNLCGLDPTKTVVLGHLPHNQTPLYRTQILDQIGSKVSTEIDYIADTTSRAYLVFKDNQMMLDDKVASEALGVESLIHRPEPIKRSVYMALRLGSSDRLFVREYQDQAARERMSYYHEAKNRVMEGSPRLLPCWLKLVADREPDNSRLLDTNDEQFRQVMLTDYYLEVKANLAQERADAATLAMASNKEMDMAGAHRNARQPRPAAGAAIEEEEEAEAVAGMPQSVFKLSTKMLQGPSSPIELKFRSVLQKSSGYSVDVDPSSVNAVLLNPDYKTSRRQMLVAATVTQTRRNRIMARDTTLMPNIRGLASLMALTFAQYYRLVYNQNLGCLSGAVFGLGWDERDEPVDRQYEVELSFDVHITMEDMELVNTIRRLISDLIRFMEVQNPGAPMCEQQSLLRQALLSLIKKRRYPLSELASGALQHDEPGSGLVRDKHNVPESQLGRLEAGQRRAFLPVAKLSRFVAEAELYESIRANLDLFQLVLGRQQKPPRGGLRCLLCWGGLGDFYILQRSIEEHARSERHEQQVAHFELFERRLLARLEAEQAALLAAPGDP